MNTIKLNKEQLEFISEKISLRGFSYYDVKMEMTDHVASEIEELMAADDLVFEKAMSQIFAKYGKSHFVEIEKKITTALNEKTQKAVRKGFVEFFTIPKLFFTVLLFVVLHYVVSYIFVKPVYLGILAIALIEITIMVYFKRKYVGSRKIIQVVPFYWTVLLFQVSMGNIVFFGSELIGFYPIAVAIVATMVLLYTVIITQLFFAQLDKLKKQFTL